jgi:hypothetical protein
VRVKARTSVMTGGALARAVRDAHPGCFAIVMASRPWCWPGCCSRASARRTRPRRTGWPWARPPSPSSQQPRSCASPARLRLNAVRAVITGLAVIFGALASCLIPPLIARSAWRHLHRNAQLRYRSDLWMIVFPADMYATAGMQFGTAAGLPLIQRIGTAARSLLCSRAPSWPSTKPARGDRACLARPSPVVGRQAVLKGAAR